MNEKKKNISQIEAYCLKIKKEPKYTKKTETRHLNDITISYCRFRFAMSMSILYVKPELLLKQSSPNFKNSYKNMLFI
jgi:hypothetical protein